MYLSLSWKAWYTQCFFWLCSATWSLLLTQSFLICCLDLLPYSLSGRIWELECSLCLVEGELYYHYWFYVTIVSKKLVLFSNRSLGKRSVAFCMLVLISPTKSQENCIFCKMWATGSSITSVALQKMILEQLPLFLKKIIPLLLNY